MESDRKQDAVESDVPFGRRFRNLKGKRCFLSGETNRRFSGTTSILATHLDTRFDMFLYWYHNGVHLECGYREYHSTCGSTNGKYLISQTI